ncbi:MAG: hypothetical protein WC969_09465 [Elusimicrobiota bacterium]|jgi:hypothetical protein
MRLLAASAMLAVIAASGGPGDAQAATPDSVTLTVTIGNALSVRIRDAAGADLTNYDFGSMLLGQASVNTNPINIDNDSGGLTETMQLSIWDNPGNPLVLRTDTNPLGSGEFRVAALFQDAAPGVAAFANEDIVTGAPQTAQSSGANAVFATSTSGPAEDGVNVPDDNRLGTPPTAEIRLWLRLELGASSPVTGLQTNIATVYVNAI